MKINSYLLILCLFTIYSCGNKLEVENQELAEKIDSLAIQLSYATQAIDVLAEVGSTLDSIEAEREILRFEMLEGGISDDDFSNRIVILNDMLAQAEDRVNALEQSNARSSTIIRKLREDLAEQTKTITFLEGVLETSRRENISLKQAMVRQADEIKDLESDIVEKRQELALIEEQVQSMMIEAKKSEAEALYARAEAYEETANRTKLAPKKKKETLKQALELYKQSEELGFEKASEKVKELEGKVG